MALEAVTTEDMGIAPENFVKVANEMSQILQDDVSAAGISITDSVPANDSEENEDKEELIAGATITEPNEISVEVPSLKKRDEDVVTVKKQYLRMMMACHAVVLLALLCSFVTLYQQNQRLVQLEALAPSSTPWDMTAWVDIPNPLESVSRALEDATDSAQALASRLGESVMNVLKAGASTNLQPLAADL